MTTKLKKDQKVGKAPRGGRRSAPTVRENPVHALRQDLGISQEMMARLLDVSLRTLSRLETADEPKPPRSFGELSRLTEGLLSVIRKESLSSWLDRPNEAFGGLKPIEAIERGEVDRLWKMIHQVGAGEPM